MLFVLQRSRVGRVPALTLANSQMCAGVRRALGSANLIWPKEEGPCLPSSTTETGLTASTKGTLQLRPHNRALSLRTGKPPAPSLFQAICPEHLPSLLPYIHHKHYTLPASLFICLTETVRVRIAL